MQNHRNVLRLCSSFCIFLVKYNIILQKRDLLHCLKLSACSGNSPVSAVKAETLLITHKRCSIECAVVKLWC